MQILYQLTCSIRLSARRANDSRLPDDNGGFGGVVIFHNYLFVFWISIFPHRFVVEFTVLRRWTLYRDRCLSLYDFSECDRSILMRQKQNGWVRLSRSRNAVRFSITLSVQKNGLSKVGMFQVSTSRCIGVCAATRKSDGWIGFDWKVIWANFWLGACACIGRWKCIDYHFHAFSLRCQLNRRPCHFVDYNLTYLTIAWRAHIDIDWIKCEHVWGALEYFIRIHFRIHASAVMRRQQLLW